MHKDRPEQRANVKIDSELQASVGRVVKLKVAGNMLLASGEKGGLLVLDISEPLNPYVVSAGNDENIESVDIYKGRILAAGGTTGLRVMDLPHSLVTESSIKENGFIAENHDLVIGFNERITTLSILEAGNVSVTRLDTNADVTVTITPLNVIADHAREYSLNFARESGVRYQIKVNDARNLRSTALWRPYTQYVRAATVGAVQPSIQSVQGGIYHRGDNQPINIIGSNFRNDPAVKVYIDQFEVPATSLQWVDATTIQIAPGAIEIIPLALGEHHVRVVDNELMAALPGSIIMGESLDLVNFKVSPESGTVKGGPTITVTSSMKSILPGTKVIMRPRIGEDIRTLEVSPGIYVSDMKDDVKRLNTFEFRLPGVVKPGRYDVLLDMAGKEVKVGEFSYALESGREVDLPNYPPMQIGGADTVGDTLYVGVKAGSKPTEENRFLMETGFEIYDIAIWDRPVRLSQMRTTQPVTGVAVYGGTAYLASGSDGLLVVDIHDPTAPITVTTQPVPGNKATDVAVNKATGVLAMSVANELGSGFVRFYDVHDPELDVPVGYTTLVFAEGELAGQPVDVQWLNDQLYVLLNRGGSLHIAIFSGLGTANVTHTVQMIERGTGGSLDSSFVVQYGQIAVSNGNQYIVLQETTPGIYDTIYWQDSKIDEIFANQGSLFVANEHGLVDTPAPELAVTAFSPASGSDITANELIRVQFNKLYNTDPLELANDIQITDVNGNAIPATAYTIEGINTLYGGYVDIKFIEPLTYSGQLTISVTQGVTALNGYSALVKQLDLSYNLVGGVRPVIDKVARVFNAQAGLHYFHADGTETASILGSNFGADVNALQIQVAESVVLSSDITLISDTEVQFVMPNLFLGVASASLPVTVTRNGIAVVSNGAVVIQPKVIVQDVYPDNGPPQGGNTIDIYGRGFSHNVNVKFAGVVAGDLRVLSGNHVQVRAPSGSFGYADVSVSSELFPGEESSLSDAYFYAGRETGSVDLSQDGHKSSPVTAIALHGQILYSVTGGGYDPIDREGRVLPNYTTSKAQLVVADISDPVHPIIVEKQFIADLFPYHIDVTLPPDGFRDIAIEDNNMYLIGGNRLYHFDLTLPAEPLLLTELSMGLEQTINGIAVSDDLVYLSGVFGLKIYRLQPDRTLLELKNISASVLGGEATSLSIYKDVLRVMVPNKAQILELELKTGNFEAENIINLIDLAGNRLNSPAGMLAHDDLLMVTTGRRGSVMLYGVRPDNESVAVAELPLAYLIRNGDLNAGDMLLTGQTLYVAAGQGDIQLFDIAPWLDNQYRAPISLRHYFAVNGDIDSIAYGQDAIYAGTSFVYVDGEPAQNPIEVGAHVNGLGGALNTIVNDQLNIVDQVPSTRGYLNSHDAIEIQFNRLIDNIQISELADQLLDVSVSGIKVQGFVSSRVTNTGTRLLFRPVIPFANGLEHRVTVSAAIRDLHGETLTDNYSFRFVASDSLMPTIEQVKPAYGSWRGSEEVTIFGNNLDVTTKIEIAGIDVDSSAIISVQKDQMTFRVPKLRAPPEENKVAGITLSNGLMSTFRAGRFTYVAEPNIQAIGAYNRTTNILNSSNHRVLYNAGEHLAIQGTGLNAITQIYINGKSAIDSKIEGPNLISFRAPENTVGTLNIEVSNLPNKADSVTNTSISVDLESQKWIKHERNSYRADDLLLLTNDTSAKLFTTADGPSPVLLSEFDFEGQKVNAATISERYALFSIGTDHELWTYDITNVYAPVRINRMFNPASTSHGKLHLVGETFIGSSGNTLHVGHVRGADWQTETLTAIDPTWLAAQLGAIDSVVDGEYVYLLYEAHIEVRSLYDIQALIDTYPHVLSGPQRLKLSAQRLMAIGVGELELINTGQLSETGTLQKLGSINTLNQAGEMIDLAITGELLAVYRNSSKIDVYDINLSQFDSRLELDHISRVYPGFDISNNSQLRIHKDLLEWSSLGFYQNVQMPMPNIVTPVPQLQINTETEIVQFQVSGEASAWDPVIVDVSDSATDTLLNGDTIFLGDKLQFRLLGNDLYQVGEHYNVSLYNPPAAVIDGGQLQFDLPWSLSTAPLFGIMPAELLDVQPSTTITGRETQYTVIGQHLDQLESLQFNSTDIPASSWTLSEDATQLSFNFTSATPGVFNLNGAQSGHSSTLPAAIVVSQALEVSSATSSNARGNTNISDSGQDLVTLAGLGFEGELEVYFMPDATGFEPGPATSINFNVRTAGIQFKTPVAVHDQAYRIVVRKPSTGEEVNVTTLLYGVDDTKPRLSSTKPLDYFKPLRLAFDETVVASNFSVTSQSKDYSTNPVQDISNRFEMRIVDNIIEVRLLPGNALEHNRLYTAKVNGIFDSHANMALNSYGLTNGIYSSTFLASDTLVPRDINLVRTSDNQTVNTTMTLTRGRTYTFEASAFDNYTAGKQLTYEIRKSINGGLSFAAPFKIYSNGTNYPRFSHDVQESNGNLAFIVKVIDRNANYASQRYDVTVIDPTINIGGIYTNPVEVEEITRADIRFDLDGDVDLIKDAKMRVRDRWYPVDVSMTTATTANVSLSYLNPKLAEISPSNQIPVSLNVTYGFTGVKQVDATYTLFLDKTPPTLSIASPGDGDKIAINDKTDVLIQSFDRYGIDRVEVQVNGAGYQVLNNPNKFSFTATTFDPVTIDARAWDPNNNFSTPVSITVQPFDATAGEPTVQLLAPINGSVFHAGEDIQLEMVLRQISTADIYFDIGGVEASTKSFTATRAAEDPERFPFTVTLPKVTQDSVVVVRAQSGGLKARLYLNVLVDNGIEVDPVLSIFPSTRILSGTELWLEAQTPKDVLDVADDSAVIVKDPVTTLTPQQFAMDVGPRSVHVSAQGTNVNVDAILRDRSHNERIVSRNLTKLPYLGDVDATIFTPVDSDDVTEHMLSVPGLRNGVDDVVWVVNRRTGGYRIQSVDGIIHTSVTGRIDKMFFTGTGLLAQESRSGNVFLIYIPLTNGAFTTALSSQIYGEVLGGHGESFFMQHGSLMNALQFVDGRFEVVAGQVINEPIVSTVVAEQHLFVLSESGLYTFVRSEQNVSELVELSFVALPSMQGMQVNNNQLVTWNESTVSFYQININNSLNLLSKSDAGGRIRQAQYDGEIWWILADGPITEDTWQAWHLGELVGLRPVTVKEMSFAGNKLYELLAGVNAGVIQRRSLLLRQLLQNSLLFYLKCLSQYRLQM